jgi:hypothetical protein
MGLNFREIREGWKNHIMPSEEEKAHIKEVSDYRLSICQLCEFNSTPNKIKTFSRCKQCGCPLIQKSKALSSSCPINKWHGETDSKEGAPMETPSGNPDND